MVRIGATVRRPAGPWSPAVHGLLRHLRERGFTASPGVHGTTDDGFEILDFLRAQAAAGSAASAGHLADGHDLQYLADAAYLDERRAVFDRALGPGG